MEIVKKYETVTKRLLHLLDSLTEQELNTVPFEGSWTAAQVGDHLYQAYGIGEMLEQNRSAERDPMANAAALHAIFDNDAQKYKSPEAIVPSNRHFDKARLLTGIKKRVDALKQAILEKGLEKAFPAFEFPGIGVLTGYEHLVLATVHTDRHNRQLERIIKRLH